MSKVNAKLRDWSNWGLILPNQPASGVDRMQRNFEPTRKQVEARQRSELTDVTAKVVFYKAFVEGRLEAPKHLARTVYDLYFEPRYDEFRSRTIWSLSNAFTSVQLRSTRVFAKQDPVRRGMIQAIATGNSHSGQTGSK